MSESDSKKELLNEIHRLRQENLRLRNHSNAIDSKASSSMPMEMSNNDADVSSQAADSNQQSDEENSKRKRARMTYCSHTLTNDEVSRYGRQLILAEAGVDAQMSFAKARVLIVGAGGLGAPVALYLAAAGVGHITIIDGDIVETDNLHRQVIHSERTLGTPKAESARDACLALNSSIQVSAIVDRLGTHNAMQLAKDHDILVDCSDNVGTRYLINDAAILNGKVVVSGSALRLEGQCTIYGYQGGPCYRCLYPKPPPPHTVTNCNDGGVLGCITGIIGSFQALEVLKIIGMKSCDTLSQRLLLFDGFSSTVRCVKLRPRQKNCAVCGDDPTISELINYEVFCSASLDDKPTAEADGDRKDNENTEQSSSCSVQEYASIAAEGSPHLLLDCRELEQFSICSLPGSSNVPISLITKQIKKEEARCQEDQSGAQGVQVIPSLAPLIENLASKNDYSGPLPVYVICRRGVFSKHVAKELNRMYGEPAGFKAINIRGGLVHWSKHVDPSCPIY